MIDTDEPLEPDKKSSRGQISSLQLFIILGILVIGTIIFSVWYSTMRKDTENKQVFDTNQTSEILTFEDITVTPKDKNLAIISVVEYSEGKVSFVSLYLPDRLVGTDLYIDKQKLDNSTKENADNLLPIVIPAKFQSEVVTLIFKSDIQILATCTIAATGTPIGDCTW